MRSTCRRVLQIAAWAGVFCCVAPRISTAESRTPGASNVPPSDPLAACNLRCRAELKARIRCNPALWRRWVRGSLLLGFGVPVVVAGVAMLPAGAVVWGDSHQELAEHGDDARRRMRMGIGLTWVGAALLAGGAVMTAFGRRHRDAAMMSARLRWDLSIVPGRSAAQVGLTPRF